MNIQCIRPHTNIKKSGHARQSFKRAPGMSTGANGNYPPHDNKPVKRNGGLLDVIYWTIIANTLAVNPAIYHYYKDKRDADLKQVQQDDESYNTYDNLRKSISENDTTSNALYHLTLFNSTEMPKLKKLDDSLYSAKFNTGDKEVGVTFSTTDLDKNIISGEIVAKDEQTTDVYSYKLNLDTLGSKSFDIELKAQNDTNSVKQTYERDNYGALYFVDKENNKKIPVNEYSMQKVNAKNELEDEINSIDETYKQTQKFNYMICFIATIFQMMRYSRNRNEQEEQ